MPMVMYIWPSFIFILLIKHYKGKGMRYTGQDKIPYKCLTQCSTWSSLLRSLTVTYICRGDTNRASFFLSHIYSQSPQSLGLSCVVLGYISRTQSLKTMCDVKNGDLNCKPNLFDAEFLISLRGAQGCPAAN